MKNARGNYRKTCGSCLRKFSVDQVHRMKATGRWVWVCRACESAALAFFSGGATLRGTRPAP